MCYLHIYTMVKCKLCFLMILQQTVEVFDIVWADIGTTDASIIRA